MVVKPVYVHQCFLHNIPLFKLNAVELDFCVEFKYLGHWLTNDFSDVKDMKREMRALYARVNNLIGLFYDCSIAVKRVLWKTFVNCLYGVGLWKLSKTCVNLYVVAYNKCLKRFLKESKYCLNRYIYGRVDLPTPCTLLHNAKMYVNIAIVSCASLNSMVRCIFSVYDGGLHNF